MENKCNFCSRTCGKSHCNFSNSLVIGSVVFDDLTFKESVIIKILIDSNNNMGYILDNDYLEGKRHPWEISVLKEEK